MVDAATRANAEGNAPYADTGAAAEGGPDPSPLLALGARIAALGVPLLDVRVNRVGELVVRVARERVRALMAALRTEPALAFEQCVDLCGVDRPGRAPERFEVVWNLLSLTHNHRVRVITTTDGDAPVPSVAAIWPSATWYEREAFDMFGIAFEGQDDLRRLLTDYGFEGHPLRKDFPLTGHAEVRYDAERREVVYEPVRLTQDFRDFDFLSPWEAMTTLPGDEKVHLNQVERRDRPVALPPGPDGASRQIAQSDAPAP